MLSFSVIFMVSLCNIHGLSQSEFHELLLCYTPVRAQHLIVLNLRFPLHALILTPLSSIFQVGENFVPPLLDAVLIDYQRNVPAAREPEVLSTMATIVNKLGGHITSEIPQIFDAVFECTLNMINKVRQSLTWQHWMVLIICEWFI